jgi:hypothetical protein
MHTLDGGCHCGNIGFELGLTRALAAYNPRACDCGFCTKHGAAYLSDPQGALAVRVQDERQTTRYRQGSGQAEFLLCSRCGVLTGVFCSIDGQLYGAVNARAVAGGVEFGPQQPVSPKMLSPGDKAKRWQEVWFPKVRVESGRN